MKEVEEKDIVVTAYPSKDKAVMSAITQKGREYLIHNFGSADSKEITGKEVNGFLIEMREQNLRHSFKAA